MISSEAKDTIPDVAVPALEGKVNAKGKIDGDLDIPLLARSNSGKNQDQPKPYKAPKPPKPTKHIPSAEELKEISSTQGSLYRYGKSHRFKKHLEDSGFMLEMDKLKKLELPQLKEMLNAVQLSIQNRSNSMMLAAFALSIVEAGENFAVNTKINKSVKLKGLTDKLKGDDGFLDTIEEIQILNGSTTVVSPYQRLGWAIVQTAAITHAINKSKDVVEAAKENVVPPDQPTSTPSVKIPGSDEKEGPSPDIKAVEVDSRRPATKPTSPPTEAVSAESRRPAAPSTAAAQKDEGDPADQT